MDIEEIQNRLCNLSRRHFRSVVAVILRNVFSYHAIDVDASGDEGSDWKVFDEDGRRIGLAIQDTTQQSQWQKKALENAKEVLASGANRYFFCTNRAHQELPITRLEESIRMETGLDPTVLDGRRLAGFLVEAGLEDAFLVAIGSAVSPKRPSMPEIALCTYSNLSADSRNHRDEIYRDTLLAICYDREALTRQELVTEALGFLGSKPEQRVILDHQVDWLLSQKHMLARKEDRCLLLSEESHRRIEQTERLYLSDWQSLEGALTSVLNEHGGNWSSDIAQQAMVLLARLFLSEQLAGLREAGAELPVSGWVGNLGDPRQKLRDLLSGCGIALVGIRPVISAFVDIARPRSIIAKLTRTAVFAALEGRDPVQSARALGANSWDEVDVLLDASVAIPFLCARRTEAVDNYMYAISSRAVDVLEELGATFHISPGHLEECASHLLNALQYQPLEEHKDFGSALIASDNAFVAFYYALRAEGRRAPATLAAFLGSFSHNAPNVARRAPQWGDSVRKVMPEIQSAFASYEVPLQQCDRVSAERYQELQRVHDFILAQEGRDKPFRLRKHDLDALSHVENRSIQLNQAWLFLTSDKTLMEVARGEMERGWVVSPEVAIDFAQPSRKLNESQWCALAHKLARVSSPIDVLTARIIDTVARLEDELLQDWEFLEDLRRFRAEAMQRPPSDQMAAIHSWVEQESQAFLEKHDVHEATTSNEDSGQGAGPES